jgi:mycothiol synthase
MTGASTTERSPSLVLPEAPAIPGLRFRTWSDDRDWESMAAVMVESSRADGVPWVATAEQLRIEKTDHPGVDPAHDIILAEVDGQLVADGEVKRVVREGEPMYEVSGHVHPAYRRRGIGDALHAWNVRRAHERAAALEPGRPVTLAAHAEEGELGAAAVAVAHGFKTAREFYLMRRDLTTPIPDATVPAGLEIRPVRPEDHRTIWDAENEAFRDHWGAREHTEHDFALTFERKELDTSLWVVAWDGDEVAGVIENWIWAEENATLGVQRGWLERVSVGRSWRRRGLGRALTATSLARLREAGMAEALLGVDSSNPMGALALYQGVGFEVHRRELAYRRTDPASFR